MLEPRQLKRVTAHAHDPQAFGAVINLNTYASSIIHVFFNQSGFTSNSVSAIGVVC
jgi:hypothetical protein